FHAPGLLADCAWFTYGRVHPAHLNALTYGFAVQAGLGVVLWMLAHLGRTRLAFTSAIILGAVLWTLGMTVGIAGILYGESTGFEWLEMPRYASVALFFGYLLIGLGAMQTLHERRERQLTTTQWFVMAALFWFPWIYSTAEFLLVGHPVRGALQAAIDCWYANNLMTVWFGFMGLAVIFYFIPKLINRPLYSHYIGIFIFWTLALFGSWGGIPPGSPLPAWMASMSTMGAVLTVVPVLAVAVNVRRTMAGDYSKMSECRPLKFFIFGAMAFVVSGLAGAAMSLMRVSKVTNFTWFLPAHTQFVLYGFFAMTMFGAIYYIVPRLLQTEFPKPSMICVHFLLAGGGILFYAVPLAIGGVKQGFALNDPSKSFAEVMLSTLLFLRISTVGDLLMALGHVVLLLNLAGILIRVGRGAVSTAWVTNTKAVEVAS
ncbi:MAG: hypothetical protein JWQ04_834, partial [Pedosphaera sp.]|nr:hypothetical protein [Pedosphaera sp.]